MICAVLVVGLGVAATTFARVTAEGRLEAANATNAQLIAEQRTHSDVSSVLSESAGIDDELAQLLADDISPTEVVQALRGAATDGVLVSSVSLDLAGAPDAAATGSSTLDDSGVDHLGSFDLTGTAPDQRTMAAYVDKLAAIKGVVVPYLVSARQSTTGAGIEFTLKGTLTADLRTARFAEETK
jgi:hypothetical protein